MMARETHLKVVTANDLHEGDVVYLTPHGDWTRTLAAAAVAADEETAQTLLAGGAAQQHRIVGAYLADVSLSGDGRPEPVHFRETFRTRGPSNYLHGKQAGA